MHANYRKNVIINIISLKQTVHADLYDNINEHEYTVPDIFLLTLLPEII
jgi:hypothetical protein